MFNSLSDEELMKLVQAGDSSALAVLYERHSSKVWSYIGRRVPKESAEDLFQDCFVKLVEKRQSWNNQPFVLWLYVVLRNLVADFYRCEKVTRRVMSNVSLIEETSMQDDFNELVSSLPEETSTILKEFFKEGWSYKELATKYALNEMTLRKRISRAVAFLKKGE